MQHTFASSNHKRPGTARIPPVSSAATASAAGSPKINAPMAEASTTFTVSASGLPGIPIFPDPFCRVSRCVQSRFPYFGDELGGRKERFLVELLMEHCHEFTLEGSMIFFRHFPEPVGQIVRNIFDRQCNRHFTPQEVAPFWRQYRTARTVLSKKEKIAFGDVLENPSTHQ